MVDGQWSKKHRMAKVKMDGMDKDLSEFTIKRWWMVAGVTSRGWPKLR